MREVTKKKNKRWFKKIRGSYLPVAWQGWLSYLPFVAYLVCSVIIVCTSTLVIYKIIYEVVPLWLAATIIMTWLAQHKS